MKSPDWIKNILNTADEKPKGRDQITIVAISPTARLNGRIAPPISMSRMTGEGEDGALQPGKVAGDVHEGEMVLSANATQALPADVRQELVKQAESGSLDVNALRSALKLPAKPGYALGSFGLPIISQAVDKVKTDLTNPSATTDALIGATNKVKSVLTGNTSTQPSATIGPLTGAIAGDTSTVAPVFKPIDTSMIVNNSEAQKVVPPKIVYETPTPIDTSMIVNNSPTQKVVPPKIVNASETTPDNTTPSNTPTNTPTNTQRAPTYYDNVINSSLRRVTDTAEGKSAAERNIANQNLANFDTRAANELAAQEMNTAMQGDMPANAKASALAQANSGIRSSRSKLIGDMSAGAAERASQANQTAADMASQERTYKDNAGWKSYEAAIDAGDFTTAAAAYKQVTGSDINMNQMVTYQNYLNKKQGQEIASGDIALDLQRFGLSASKTNQMVSDINNGVPMDTINATYGTNLKQNDYDNIAVKYKNSLASQDIALDLQRFGLSASKTNQMVSDINNGVPMDTINATYGTNLKQNDYDNIATKYKISIDSLKTTLGTEKVNAISGAINNGMTLEKINLQFPGTNLTQSQYDVMYSATPRAQTDRQNAMQDIQSLIAAGPAENAPAIISTFKKIGVNLNPSYLVSGEKSKQFNDAMSAFTTLIATPGMDAKGAIGALKQSGQYDVLSSAFGGAEPQWTGDPGKNPVAIATAGGDLDSSSANWLIDNGYTLTGKRADNGGITATFNTMKGSSNPIDAAWKTYSDSTWFKALSPKDQADTKVKFDYMMSGGDLPYTVTYDANGKPTIVPKTEGEVAGQYTGTPWSPETLNILKDPKNPQYDSVLTANYDALMNSNDFSKYANLAKDDPVKKAIKSELDKNAKSWTGGISLSSVDKTGGKDGKFIDPPAKGQVITFKGKTYVVDSSAQSVTRRTSKNTYNHQTIQLRDPESNTVYEYATDTGSLSNISSPEKTPVEGSGFWGTEVNKLKTKVTGN